MSRVTLKDIASACGVTPALVSVVLNNRLGKITCVPEKKEQILKTAKEMGYHPNELARFMVNKYVPVAALMFHHNADSHAFSGGYFARRSSLMTFALEEFQINPLLVFYRSEEEQISKLESLWHKGIIGGVISNIFHDSHLAFIAKLKELKIPYVIMGNPKTQALSVSERGDFKYTKEYMQLCGAKKTFLFQELGGKEVLFSWVDKPDYVRFDHGPIPATEEITADPDNLIVILGAEYILRSKLKFAHPLIMEQEHMAYLIPENLPNVIIRNSCTEGSVAAKLLWQWMSGGNAPEESHHYISQSTVIAKNF